MLQRLLSLVLVVSILLLGTGCARSSASIKPGDKIGEMAVVKATTDALRYTDLCRYSEGTPNPIPPGTYEINCQVPPSKLIWIADGWLAKDQQTRDENWRAFTFEMYIDNQQVDLEAFGTIDEERDGNSGRAFSLALENASGKHIIRLVHHIKADVFDGYETYKAGTIDTTNNVTITSE